MKPSRFKKLLLQIHLYSGLLFLPYLIIFGLSTLHINHHFPLFEENKNWTNETAQYIHFQNVNDNQLLAENIRDSLHLTGWCPWWTQNKDGNEYRFTVDSFGSEYRISAVLNSGKVILTRRSKGFWNILHSLHYLSEDVPNAPVLVNVWQYYQDATVLYLLMAVISGIYLFLKGKRGDTSGLILLVGLTAISIILMLYIWLIG